jgi:hypothetical protein
VDFADLRKGATSRPIHKADRLTNWWLDPKFIETLEGVVGRDTCRSRRGSSSTPRPAVVRQPERDIGARIDESPSPMMPVGAAFQAPLTGSQTGGPTGQHNNIGLRSASASRSLRCSRSKGLARQQAAGTDRAWALGRGVSAEILE